MKNLVTNKLTVKELKKFLVDADDNEQIVLSIGNETDEHDIYKVTQVDTVWDGAITLTALQSDWIGG